MLDAPWAPFTIDFNLANIGGPSAGLMFSLAVVDKLTTGDLNGVEVRRGHRHHHRRRQGRLRSAASPTRSSSAQEAGATVFLVPADNCDEAKSADETDIELVKVDTLERCGRRAAARFPPVANLLAAEPASHAPMRRVSREQLLGNVREWS